MLQQTVNVSYVIAFLAGLLSFISPCVLPLIPSYLSYITGISFEKLIEHPKEVQRITARHSLFFIGGFSLMFIVLGLSFSWIGQALLVNQVALRQVGGGLIIFLGLYLTGLLNFLPFLRFLKMEKKFHLQNKPVGYFSSFLVGITFAIAWTPCIGPILGAILVYAGSTQTALQGGLLLAAYSLGLGLPFFLASLALNTFLAYFNQFKKYLGVVEIISGIFLIFVGILVFTNYFALFALRLNQLLPFLNFNPSL